MANDCAELAKRLRMNSEYYAADAIEQLERENAALRNELAREKQSNWALVDAWMQAHPQPEEADTRGTGYAGEAGCG
jgi:hypothetical protein